MISGSSRIWGDYSLRLQSVSVLTYRKPIMLFISLVAGTQPKKIKQQIGRTGLGKLKMCMFIIRR